MLSLSNVRSSLGSPTLVSCIVLIVFTDCITVSFESIARLVSFIFSEIAVSYSTRSLSASSSSSRICLICSSSSVVNSIGEDVDKGGFDCMFEGFSIDESSSKGIGISGLSRSPLGGVLTGTSDRGGS